MCYSTTNRKKQEEMERKYQAIMHKPLQYEPYFHLNGFTHGNLQIITMEEPDMIYPAAWGFVPDWGMDDISGFWKNRKYNTLNARSEGIIEAIMDSSKRSMYLDSAREKRCLVLADGFFEPHEDKKTKITHPYFCHIPTDKYKDGSDLFAFAGIYNEIDEESFTVSILTLQANEFFSEVHNKREDKRMPLVLDDDYVEDWLDDWNDSQLIELLETSFTNKEFEAYSVSRDLYKRNIDTNIPSILMRTSF